MKAIIDDQDIPMYMWVEAITKKVYVQNKISIVPLGIKLYKKFFWRKDRGNSPKYIWLSCIHSHSQGENNKVISFRKEGFVRRI